MCRNRRLRITAILVGIVLATACTPPSAPVPEVATVPTAPNPDLQARCGLDVNLVLDRSSSIGSLAPTVRSAAQSFVDALAPTGSRVRTVSFGSTATAHPAGGPGVSAIGALSWSTADSYVVPTLVPGGGTNLDDALEMVRRAPGDQAPLTVVFTDGSPNGHMASSPDGHGGAVANHGRSLDEAIVEANLLKAQGSHLFAIGIGQVAVKHLEELTGPDEFTAAESVATADYAHYASLAQLSDAFSALARGLCAPSLSLRKIVRETDGQTNPAAGWQFDLDASPTPNWIQPSGGVHPAITGISGTVTATWAPKGQTINFLIREEQQPGMSLASVECSVNHFDGNGPQPLSLSGSYPIEVSVGPQDAVRCTVVNEVTSATSAGSDVVLIVDQPSLGAEHPDVGVTLEWGSEGSAQSQSVVLPVGGRHRWSNLAAGPASLRVDALPVGWTLLGITCNGIDGDLASASVNFPIGNHSVTTCRVLLEQTLTNP